MTPVIAFVDLIFLPLQIFLLFPALALVPAGCFAFFYFRRRRREGRGSWTLIVAALIWAAYAIYEYRMSLWAETVSAPIRVDLLLIGPVLYATLILVFLGWIGRRVMARRARPPDA